MSAPIEIIAGRHPSDPHEVIVATLIAGVEVIADTSEECIAQIVERGRLAHQRYQHRSDGQRLALANVASHSAHDQHLVVADVVLVGRREPLVRATLGQQRSLRETPTLSELRECIDRALDSQERGGTVDQHQLQLVLAQAVSMLLDRHPIDDDPTGRGAV